LRRRWAPRSPARTLCPPGLLVLLSHVAMLVKKKRHRPPPDLSFKKFGHTKERCPTGLTEGSSGQSKGRKATTETQRRRSKSRPGRATDKKDMEEGEIGHDLHGKTGVTVANASQSTNIIQNSEVVELPQNVDEEDVAQNAPHSVLELNDEPDDATNENIREQMVVADVAEAAKEISDATEIPTAVDRSNVDGLMLNGAIFNAHSSQTEAKDQSSDQAGSRPLHSLNKRHFSGISQRVKAQKERVEALQRVMLTSPDQSTTREEHSERDNLNVLLKVEEKFYRQLLRFRWTDVGDRNTAFYHQTVSQHASRNHIHFLKDGHDHMRMLRTASKGF
ncbi:hypothetical protein HID58_061523, partial [Brassica napus]